jgi:hypothetical protein
MGCAHSGYNQQGRPPRCSLRRLGPLSNLTFEQRRYYRLWWRKYTALKLLAQIGLLVCLVCGILSFGEQAVSHVARAVVYPAVWITIGSTLWWTLLECPRCGAKFSGWWGLEFDVWNLSECQECGLSCSELSALSKKTW